MVRLLLIFLASLSIQPATAGEYTIAIARLLEPGTRVTVEGSVTVPSGAFSSSTFDQGFALQDETAGIYVSVNDDSRLQFHRRVRVTGQVVDDGYGQLVLRPESGEAIEVLEGAQAVRPESSGTGAVGEATEGRLVEVVGRILRGPTDDLPYGYSLYIDDGSGEVQVFIPASTGINPFRIGYLRPGVTIRVTGLSSQFLANLEVLPRIVGDIQRSR
ncbi:MAG: hypothetical protein ACO38Y_10710 [Steroidobacteraceae bacterium]